MTPRRWSRIREILAAARERPESRRAAFLDATCEGDVSLRAEVAALLAEGDGDSLFSPTAGPPGGCEYRPGDTIGQYRVEGKLGEGGMGVVYKARDTRLNRTVAIKLSTARFSGRFEQEARAVAALNHPHICTLYEVGPGYLVMEYIEGKPLSGPLPLPEALRLTVQLLDALAAAHRQGIVHRDLKPANVMLTQFGVKVLDFGLAKMIPAGDAGGQASTVTDTMEGTVLGTPHYMSPEQARSEGADGRSDLFSVGVLLYEMTTGERPFTGKSTPEILAAVLKETPVWPSQRLAQVPAGLDAILGKALQKDRALRYQSAEEMTAACQQLLRGLEAGTLEPAASAKTANLRGRRLKRILAGTVSALAVGSVVVWLLDSHKVHALGATDTVVLADFVNRTGDAVFDDTLKEALSAELQQSPFLSILPPEKVAATLKLMGRPKDTPLAQDMAREVCLRAGSRAYISGSIARVGQQYFIALQAVECRSAQVMAREQATAGGTDQVLHALGEAGKGLRERVGESLATVEKFDTPLDQVTTPSLEALKPYTMGRKALLTTDSTGAEALFQWAVRQDPNFAMAILSLGLSQLQLNESARAAANFRRAYELREKVSEWEKFAIESRYYLSAVGDLEKAIQTYSTWAKTYPREPVPIGNLAEIEFFLGHHERALEYLREYQPLRTPPDEDTGFVYLALNRLDDAKSFLREVVKNTPNNWSAHLGLYIVAFLQGDAAEMSRQVAWSAGKSGVEDQFIAAEASSAAYAGKVSTARQLAHRAVTLAVQADEKEVAATYEAAAGLREALAGYRVEARQHVAAALKLSNARDLDYGAGLALAIAGDTRGAEALANQIDRLSDPANTITHVICLPVIQGQLAIDRKDYGKALETLQAAAPYELGYWATFWPNIYAAYVRAEAYLGAWRYGEAAAEFEKVLSHRGIVGYEPIGPLSRLNLARAYAGQHDILKAKESYETFLALWKNADPDIPVLKEAQAEYRKLK